MRGFLERQLRSDGLTVLAFPSTEAAAFGGSGRALVLGDPDALDRRRVHDCPVIVLGRADPEAKVRALARCDDYLARPFVYEELVARIRALLRRCPPRRQLPRPRRARRRPRRARRALARGREILLSQKEYALLVKLASDPDRPHARAPASRRVGYSRLRARRDDRRRTPRESAASSPAAGLDDWVVNAWGSGHKLRPDAAGLNPAGGRARGATGSRPRAGADAPCGRARRRIR